MYAETANSAKFATIFRNRAERVQRLRERFARWPRIASDAKDKSMIVGSGTTVGAIAILPKPESDGRLNAV